MEVSFTDDELQIEYHILLMPGPFTTPRAVCKTIQFSERSCPAKNFRKKYITSKIKALENTKMRMLTTNLYLPQVSGHIGTTCWKGNLGRILCRLQQRK